MGWWALGRRTPILREEGMPLYEEIWKTAITEDEVDMIVEALTYRRNMVETGDPVLCQQDLVNMKRPAKHLTHDQMKLIVHCNELIEKLRGMARRRSG